MNKYLVRIILVLSFPFAFFGSILIEGIPYSLRTTIEGFKKLWSGNIK